jgi:hypothetical protein
MYQKLLKKLMKKRNNEVSKWFLLTDKEVEVTEQSKREIEV